MFFASDNAGPAAPDVLEALGRANHGYVPSYGADPLTGEVAEGIRAMFDAPEAAVYLVGTGTAANALGLACLTRPWQAVFAHRVAHIEEDECGAPEFFTGGAKLALVEGDHGRIDPEALAARIAETGERGVHSVQRGPVSVTQATELGTVYRPEDLERIGAIAAAHGLPLHMDGARFANAVARLGARPAELSWQAGVKVLSLGGTKNGLIGAEAVVLFDPELAWEFELRRKRGGHLFSKHRYLAAQFAAWLEDGLWLRLARAANDAADRLAEALAALRGARILHPVEANMVFVSLPRAAHRRALEAGAQYYLWPFDQPLEGDPDEPLTCRLVTNWATTADEIAALLRLFAG